MEECIFSRICSKNVLEIVFLGERKIFRNLGRIQLSLYPKFLVIFADRSTSIGKYGNVSLFVT